MKDMDLVFFDYFTNTGDTQKQMNFLHFWSQGGTPRPPGHPLESKVRFFIDLVVPPARFLRAFGGTLGRLWGPLASLWPHFGAPVAARGHQKRFRERSPAAPRSALLQLPSPGRPNVTKT